MKRATTMNNIEWSWDKEFVHGEVQFNIKHQTKLFYFVALKFAVFSDHHIWQTMIQY
jgi:surface antigen